MLHVLLVSSPVVAFASLMVWFSENRIPPVAAVEGSATNPVGLLTSNFVYNGSENVENIVVSSLFLLFVFLYYPRVLRLLSAYMLPFIAVAAGGSAQATAIATVYATPRICGDACSFYGMSGVSNAVIGFTIASFGIALGLMVLQGGGRMSIRDMASQTTAPTRTSRLRRQLSLAAALALYVLLLLSFAGLVALPTAVRQPPGPGSATTTTTTGPTSPPAIFAQTPPVWIVHLASLAYGFVLSVAVLFLVNRRHRVFFVPAAG